MAGMLVREVRLQLRNRSQSLMMTKIRALNSDQPGSVPLEQEQFLLQLLELCRPCHMAGIRCTHTEEFPMEDENFLCTFLSKLMIGKPTDRSNWIHKLRRALQRKTETNFQWLIRAFAMSTLAHPTHTTDYQVQQASGRFVQGLYDRDVRDELRKEALPQTWQSLIALVQAVEHRLTISTPHYGPRRTSQQTLPDPEEERGPFSEEERQNELLPAYSLSEGNPLREDSPVEGCLDGSSRSEVPALRSSDTRCTTLCQKLDPHLCPTAAAPHLAEMLTRSSPPAESGLERPVPRQRRNLPVEPFPKGRVSIPTEEFKVPPPFGPPPGLSTSVQQDEPSEPIDPMIIKAPYASYLRSTGYKAMVQEAIRVDREQLTLALREQREKILQENRLKREGDDWTQQAQEEGCPVKKAASPSSGYQVKEKADLEQIVSTTVGPSPLEERVILAGPATLVLEPKATTASGN